MLIQADFSGLELRVAADLAKDKVMMTELSNGVDLHEDNRQRFGLEQRVTAKILVFRTLYGGNEFSFINDSDFNWISKDPRFWKQKLETFYFKYKGIADWHLRIVRQATRTGVLTIPSGRTYLFAPKKDRFDRLQWPITDIKNYPVQGFAADLVMVARVDFFKRLRELNLRSVVIGTIHDSIIVDSPNEEVPIITKLLEECVKDVPTNIRKLFNYEFEVPTTCEIKVGPNLKEMTKYAI